MSQAELRSAVPGRVRVRVRGRHRPAEELQGLSEALARTSGVLGVQANPRTGSLLVHYDESTIALDGLRAALEELGVAVTKPDGFGGDLAVDPAIRVRAAVNGLDRRLHETTDGVGLRFLVPAGLAGLAGRQAVRHGPRLRDAPWYVLAWYAFNTFVKLNDPQREARRRDDG